MKITHIGAEILFPYFYLLLERKKEKVIYIYIYIYKESQLGKQYKQNVKKGRTYFYDFMHFSLRMIVPHSLKSYYF